MAKKILSFEEYAQELKAAGISEEEKENEECPCGTDEEGNCLECEEGTEAPAEEIEDEEDDSDDDTDDAEDSDDEGDSDDEDEDDDEDDDDEDEDDDEEEAEESGEEAGEEEVAEEPEAEAGAEVAPEAAPTVEAMLSEGYNKVKEAACAYEKDEYQDHTLEMYMKENAALVAALAAKAMEEGYGEVKETELTQEMYEAMCNELKEAYAKKIDELKETYGAGEE